MNTFDKYVNIPDPRETIAAIDSGGFTELKNYGRWRTTADQYAEKCHRIDKIFGSQVEWFSPQDWMCEPVVIKGGRTKDGVFVGTNLSVEEHQRRTVQNFIRLRKLVPKIIPAVQGYAMTDYYRCMQMYADHGVDLRQLPIVGVGSVCRRQSTNEASLILRNIASETGSNLHGFGFKADGIINCAKVLQSADTFAWSFAGRRRPNINHEHYKKSSRFFSENFNKRGCADDCGQCPEYCIDWRSELIAKVNDNLKALNSQMEFMF